MAHYVSIAMSKHKPGRKDRFMIVLAIPIFVISNSVFGDTALNDTVNIAYSQPEPTNLIESNTTKSVEIKDMPLE